MFVEISKKPINEMEVIKSPNKKPSYSIKKLMKQLVKLIKSHKLTTQPIEKCIKKAEINEGFDSLDTTYMTEIEYDCASMMSYNSDCIGSVSTKAVSCEMEDFDLSTISATIPVHFIRNEQGSFFWTATSDIPVDNDLIEPLCCSTNNQLACIQDRWTHV